MNGGEHNDFLTGDAGVDFLAGGTGKDIFDFNATTDSGTAFGSRDFIAEFRVAPGSSTAFEDRFDLPTIDAKAGIPGNDMSTLIGLSGFTGFTGEGQVRAVQDGVNTLLQFNTTGTGGTEMTITLGDFIAASLTSADFFE